MAWVKTEEIGSGSFGSVYKAVHSENPSLVVAIKYANPGSSLTKEIKILQKLQGCNNHIIKLYSQTNPNRMVLEYASEGSLFTFITQNYPSCCGIPEPDARVYTRMILKGLCFMHQKHVVHCDLTPENILVFASSGRLRQLKIADFGLSVDLEEKDNVKDNKVKKYRGTKYYMSPESISYMRDGVVKKGIVGTALDIWSLGCVVIEMMSGCMAWGEEFETEAHFEKCIIEEKRSPAIPSQFSQPAKDFIGKCLERDRWKRWTAASLLRHPFVAQCPEIELVS